MFDPKQLLDLLVKDVGRSAQRSPRQEDANKELSELLRQFTQGKPGTSGQGAASRHTASKGNESGGSGFGFDDLLRELQRRAGGARETAGDVFGQATEGVKEGADKLGRATGLDDIIGQLSGGRSPQELLDQVQQYMRENQLGTGAVLGGLGALVFGTQAGRSLAMSAAKIGALALVGGLAYKAYQNYQQGRPLITDRSEAPAAAPLGSGFDDASATNEAAMSYIRAMIAAAAADGRLDETEQEHLLAGLKDRGLDAGAEEFLARELNAPASIGELAAGVSSLEEKVQLYTAARIAIEPDTAAERNFLARLAERLALEADLVQHINATARSAI